MPTRREIEEEYGTLLAKGSVVLCIFAFILGWLCKGAQECSCICTEPDKSSTSQH